MSGLSPSDASYKKNFNIHYKGKNRREDQTATVGRGYNVQWKSAKDLIRY